MRWALGQTGASTRILHQMLILHCKSSRFRRDAGPIVAGCTELLSIVGGGESRDEHLRLTLYRPAVRIGQRLGWIDAQWIRNRGAVIPALCQCGPLCRQHGCRRTAGLLRCARYRRRDLLGDFPATAADVLVEADTNEFHAMTLAQFGLLPIPLNEQLKRGLSTEEVQRFEMLPPHVLTVSFIGPIIAGRNGLGFGLEDGIRRGQRIRGWQRCGDILLACDGYPAVASASPFSQPFFANAVARAKLKSAFALRVILRLFRSAGCW